jgi:hypothetical protein
MAGKWHAERIMEEEGEGGGGENVILPYWS